MSEVVAAWRFDFDRQCLWSGRPANPEAADADTVAIREFNVAVHKDDRVDLSLLSVGDGLTLARKH